MFRRKKIRTIGLPLTGFLLFIVADFFFSIISFILNLNVAVEGPTKAYIVLLSTTELPSTFRSSSSSNLKGNFSFDEKCFNSKKGNSDYFSNDENFYFLETEEGKAYKKILLLDHPSLKEYKFGLGQKPFNDECCKEKRCFITKKSDKIPIEDFDAVIIHSQNISLENLPKRRKAHQRWILYENEPTVSSLYSENSEDLERIFNWTMSYRIDSDITLRNGKIHHKKDFSLIKNLSHFEYNSRPLEYIEYIMPTKKLSIFMSLNCKTKILNTEGYVKELRKFIQVDMYSRCNEPKCWKSKGKCYQMAENYKFFLLFEVDPCYNYISKHFYSILKYNVIPVVRVNGDYASIAPPHSYIDVRDFKSPKHLARYLTYLDINDTAYMEYFRWKKNYIVFDEPRFGYSLGFCDLCEKLHSDVEEKFYYDLRKWFYHEPKCKSKL